MADSTPQLPQMAAAADDREIIFNGLVDALSPSSLYGRDYTTCTGLTFGYCGGRFDSTLIADGTVLATASNTNYVVAARSTGTVSISTAITNWNDTTNYVRLYLLVAGGSSITSYQDHRQAIGGTGAGGGGGGFNEEQIQDIIASLITAGTNITKQYNDGDSPATLVISSTASGGGALTQEEVEDIAASLIVAGAGLNRQYNDGDSPATLVLTPTKVIQLACSDETTALTTGTNKIKFRMPHALTLNAGNAGVRASLSTAQATSGGGGIVTVDINEGGSTILSTKLTIDNTESTSTTAATPPVISDVSLADDAEISIDIDVIGDGTAKGLKVALIGT